MALAVIGVVGGPLLQMSRVALGSYLVVFGSAFFMMARELSRDAENLDAVTAARAKVMWIKRRRPDFVERDVETQRWMFVWIMQPFAVLIAVLGIAVIGQSLADL